MPPICAANPIVECGTNTLQRYLLRTGPDWGRVSATQRLLRDRQLVVAEVVLEDAEEEHDHYPELDLRLRAAVGSGLRTNGALIDLPRAARSDIRICRSRAM